MLPLTIVTEVVHQDDLPDEVLRAPVEDTHDGSQEGGPGLVVKCDDHGCGFQFSLPVQSLAGGAPCVGDLPVAGDLVTDLLIELVPRVFVLPDLETVASDVGFLSKVLPVDPARPRGRAKSHLRSGDKYCHHHHDLAAQTFVKCSLFTERYSSAL